MQVRAFERYISLSTTTFKIFVTKTCISLLYWIDKKLNKEYVLFCSTGLSLIWSRIPMTRETLF